MHHQILHRINAFWEIVAKGIEIQFF